MAKSVGEMMEYLDKKDEEGELANEATFMAERQLVVDRITKHGRSVQINCDDLDRETELLVKESDGEEEWQEGKKLRKDIFDIRFPEHSEQKKKLGNIKWQTRENDKGKEEKWAYFFNDDDGVLNFKRYKRKGTSLTKKYGDQALNSHEEQRAAQSKLRNEMQEMQDVGRMSTKELGLGNSGSGGCGMDIADAKAKLSAKRKLQNTLSDASSAGSEGKAGPLAALGGSANKPKAKKKANKYQDDHLSLSPDGADISNMQIDEDEGLDNPKTKPAQTFLKTAMSKLAEVKLSVQAFRNVVKVSAIDEVALTNCVRALSGKVQKIQAMQLVHCLGQYKQWINRIRAIMVLVREVNKFLHKRNSASTKWIAKLSACPELKATFATFDAAKALAHGVEFQIPKCLSVMRASAEFH